MNNNPESLIRYYEYLMEQGNKMTNILKSYPFDSESYSKTQTNLESLALLLDSIFILISGITNESFDIDKEKLRDLKIKQIIND